MPILDKNELLSSPVVNETGYTPEKFDERDVPFSRSLRASFELLPQSKLFDWAEVTYLNHTGKENTFDAYTEDNLYDPVSGKDYRGYADDFIDIHTEAANEALKSNIDKMERARNDITLGSSLMVDTPYHPLNAVLLAIGGSVLSSAAKFSIAEQAAKSASVAGLKGIETGLSSKALLASSVFKNTTYGTLSTLGMEILDKQMDPTKQWDEVIHSTEMVAGISALVGGVVGAGIADKNEFFNMIAKAEAEFPERTYASDFSNTLSAAYAKYQPKIDEESLKSALGVEKIMRFQDPVLRSTGRTLASARYLAQQISELPLKMNKNVQGIAFDVPIEREIRTQKEKIKQEFFSEIYSTYKEYRGIKGPEYLTRVSAFGLDSANKLGLLRNDGVMTLSEFMAKAKDAAEGIPSNNIFVQRAGKAYREKLFDPVLKLATDSGLFKDTPELQEFAKTYVPRLFDNGEITKNSKEFFDIAEKDFIEKRELARSQIEPMKKELSDIKDKIKTNKKEIAVVEQATMDSVYKTAMDSVKNSMDEILNEIGVPDIPKPTAEQAVNAAKKKARAKYISSLSSALNKDLDDLVSKAITKAESDILDDVLAKFNNETDSEFFDFLIDNLDTPTAQAGTDVTKKVLTERMSKARAIAAAKANATFNKELEKLLSGVDEMSAEKILRKVEAKIKSDARFAILNEASAAARAASKTLREEASVLLQQLKEKNKNIISNTWKASFDDAEIKSAVNTLINRIVGVEGLKDYGYTLVTHRPKNLPSSRRGSAKARAWDIDTGKIRKFLLNDTDRIVEHYTRSIVSDSITMKKFGTLNYDEIMASVLNEYDQLVFKARQENDLTALYKLIGKDGKSGEIGQFRDDMTALLNRARGIGPQLDGTKWADRILKFDRMMKSWNFATKMGGMMLSSFPDIARLVRVDGPLKGFETPLRYFADKSFRALSKSDAEGLWVTNDLILNTQAHGIAGVDSFETALTGVEKGLSKFGNAQSLLSGMAHWSTYMKRFAAITIQNKMLRAIERVARDGAKGKDIENLAYTYIDNVMAKRIYDQYKKYGTQYGNRYLSNVKMWDDAEAANVFRYGVAKEVDMTIVRPGADKPLWMDRVGLGLIGQFKSFSVAAMQRMLLKGLQERDMNELSGLLVGVLAGYATYAGKQFLADKEIEYDFGTILKEGIDRSGYMSWLFDVNNIVEKLSGQGLNTYLGTEMASRYQSRTGMEAAFGPTYGAILNLWNTTQAATKDNVDMTMRDINNIRGFVPLQNIPYLDPLFDAISNFAAEKIGIKQRN